MVCVRPLASGPVGYLTPGAPLPFDDQSFDRVVMKDVREHVGDPVALVDDVRRVLRPGGREFAS
jgi:ubiquinone/menaquinone biosynthesis C-methylase UbiE